MATKQTYKLRTAWQEHDSGTIVYEFESYDFGLSGDDTRMMGEQYISVTLKADGGYPFFTVPERYLEKL